MEGALWFGPFEPDEPEEGVAEAAFSSGLRLLNKGTPLRVLDGRFGCRRRLQHNARRKTRRRRHIPGLHADTRTRQPADKPFFDAFQRVPGSFPTCQIVSAPAYFAWLRPSTMIMLISWRMWPRHHFFCLFWRVYV
ncbi:hypothetical protein A0U89_11235 [Kozakia baliensis]|uniref:Uncharacterized protein n=1 Tax=Kozakia baliensis TaxID=153496 RepID=A0A1D8UVE8_9PROT|nr:hypothetical protein A0U89_11235 [Kozakia baliensis]